MIEPTSAAGEAMTTARAIVRRLEQHGVTHVFGIPGTHNLPLYRELAGSSIVHVVCRHEQGAGYAADGYARATGRPGVCLTTTGPGLLNAATAAATAYADSVPLLLISPGLPAAVEGRDTGFLHETRSQSGVMAELLGRSFRVTGAADAIGLIDEAFAGFATSRPRPLHLEVPLEVMEQSGGTEPPALPAQRFAAGPDPRATAQAADWLRAARRGVIVAGGGAVGAADQVRALASALRMPVVTSVNGKGVVSERDPLSLGASLRLRACHALLAEADVVLAVGTELAESDIWREPPLELRGRLIRIDVDPAQLGKNAAPALGIVADAGAALQSIRAQLVGLPIADRGAARGRSAAAALRREALAEGAEFLQLLSVLEDVLDPGTVIAGDSAMVCYYGAVHFLPSDAPRQLLLPTGYATLGYGLPAGIGAKLGDPERQVLVLIGDGGLLFTLSELATAVELELALPILVVNNGGYGEIRRLMLERRQPVLGADLATPDFAAVARAFGADGHLLDDLEALPALLRGASCARRPTVIELRQPRTVVG